MKIKKLTLPIGVVVGIIVTSFVLMGIQNAFEIKDAMASSTGNILYVGGTGPGNYTSIQDAINDANDGDTIFVYNESSPYYENIVINKSIVLIGEDKETTIIDGNGAGDVIWINADYVNISNFTIKNSNDSCAGIRVCSEYNIISDCNVSNNYYGIWFYYWGNNNTVYGCNIFSNSNYGVFIFYTNNNTIYNCNIYSNTWFGINIHSSDKDEIYNCTIYSNNFCGIGLSYTTNSTIHNCNISSNDEYNLRLHNSYNNTIYSCNLFNSSSGITLWYSGNNMIYFCNVENHAQGIFVYDYSNHNKIFHNNFINNTLQAHDECNNTWDNGYPMGGNYWNDYTSPDNNHGINQNKSGFDLIVDYSYNIPGGNNKDGWPHVIPDGWMKPLFAPNIILVEFNESVTNETINDTIAKYGTEIIDYLKYINIYILEINATNQSVFDILYMFQNDVNVSVASLDLYTYTRDAFKPQHLTTPNDQCYPKQWHLNNYGINPGVPTGLIDADIDAPQAWEHITDCREDVNGNDFVIAIIDSGVDLNHPDLVANLWTNPNDPPGDIANNGIDDDFDGLPDWLDPDFDGDPNPLNPDDDNNGITDDIHGADFSDIRNPDASPDDEDGHGTHCAGIICAEGNNGIGVTGVCWRAQLMVLKGNSPFRRGGLSQFERSVNYIIQQKNNGVNVRVVSYSAGISRDDLMRHRINAVNAENIISRSNIENIYRNAIQRLNNAEILFVCAVGNNGQHIDRVDGAGAYSDYPPKLTLPNIISVAASDNRDRLASFSNWGTTSVDIVAPGENILSLAMHGTYVYRDNDGDNKVSTGDRRLTSIPAIFPAGSTVRGDDTDCVEGYRIFNFDAHEKYWDKNGNNRYDAGEYIYWDGNNDNKISAGDRRLMDVYIDGELKYHHGSIVNAGDSDAENGLHSFAANERHIDLIPRNSRYEFNEDIYRDVDGNGRVSVNDIRLTTVDDESFEGNSQVQSDESDAGDCLHSFAANEKYWDWRNNNNQFDDEFIYIDKDGNNIVSIGDQRLTQVRVRVAGGVRVYSPGSFVEAGNADIGANLKPFQANEKYSLVTYMSGTSMATPMVAGEVAHFWCQFPWLTHLEVKDWILRKVDPRKTLHNTVVSGKWNDGRLRMISGFDFGDAPDPFTVNGQYPTILWHELSHGASHEDIGEEWLGADVTPEYDANVNISPPYDVDDTPNLLPSRTPSTPHPPYQATFIPDLEEYDDGVSLPAIVFAGGTYPIEFHIHTENPFINDVDFGRYDEYRADKRDSKKIYINAYFDWNRDGDWDDGGEHLVKCPAKQCTWWGGPNMFCCYGIFWSSYNWHLLPSPFIPYVDSLNKNAYRKTTFTVPADTEDEIWVRVRLDYGENAGRPPWPRWESTHPFSMGEILDDTYSHAQFGEVEDYQLYVINKVKEVGEPKYDDGDVIWVTSSTPIEIVDHPLDYPYPIKNYYRLWYDDEWSEWITYAESFHLEGEGLHKIEFYGKAISEEVIFSENFEKGYGEWAAVDVDDMGYTWQWTNITPEWIDEPIEGYFMLLDDFITLESPNTDSLISSPISCSIFNNTILYFDGEFRTRGDEKLWVNISNDYGENWTNVLILAQNASGPWIINISEIADGNIVLLNFTYSDAQRWGYGMLIKEVALYGGIVTYSPIYGQYHMVDDTPPETICELTGVKENGWYRSDVTVSLTSTDEGTGVHEIFYRINGGAWQKYTNPFKVSETSKIDFYAKDKLGNEEDIKSEDIKINKIVPPPNQPPTCSLSANLTSGYAPLSITFSMSSADTDGSISYWQLDIDSDGIAEYSGSGSPPSIKQHIYQNVGTFIAKLTVKDDDGATASDTVKIIVNETPNQPPIANFDYMPVSPVKVGEILNFIDNSTDVDGSIVNYTWDFGDGTIAYGSEINHTYNETGTYNVTLTIKDDDGDTDNYTITIEVEKRKKGIAGFEIIFFIWAVAVAFIMMRKKSLNI